MTYRIGLLGAARITPPAIVAPAKTMGRITLEAVAARDKGRAAEFAEQHGVARVLDDYAALCADPDIDLIYNALPINGHTEWTIAALNAGKHVLCEKPFAMNADEARAMQSAAEANGKRVIEAFHYRYHPAFETYLSWLADLGEIKGFEAHFNVPIPDTGHEIRHEVETGGGAMMDLGCYPLSWALMTFGRAPNAVEAEARLTPKGVDDAMTATLTFGATKANIACDMGPDAKLGAALSVEGANGTIRWINPIHPHSGSALTADINGATRSAPISHLSTYAWQLDAILNALQSGESLPTEGGPVLLQQDALDAIYASADLKHLRWPNSAD